MENGPYIEGSISKDPWGYDYLYKSPSGDLDFEILSYGADGKEGGEKENADISSSR